MLSIACSSPDPHRIKTEGRQNPTLAFFS